MSLSTTPITSSPLDSAEEFWKNRPFMNRVREEDEVNFSLYDERMHSVPVPDNEEAAQMLKDISDAAKKLIFTTNVAMMNLTKNRYSAYPYDQNLFHSPSLPICFYYNASPVEMAGIRYLATQGALPNQEHDFWKVVFASNADLIVTTTDAVEKNIAKCAPYWEKEYLPADVTSEGEHLMMQSGKEQIMMRLFFDRSRERTITQLHYMGWHDMRVPNLDLFTVFINTVNRCYKDVSRPIVAHCSAGCGRTGVFIAAHSLKKSLESNPDTINIVDWVYDMRKQRVGMVQNPQQIQTIYSYVHSLLAKEDVREEDLIFHQEL